MAGTSRQEKVEFASGTPVDELAAALPSEEVERSFLLGAGALAIYRQAGVQAQTVEAQEPAPDETLRECSPEAALLISRLFTNEHIALLPEALERMRQKNLRLPFRLLPLALNATGKDIKAALVPVLGERGRWLSQCNGAWKWVNNYLATQEDSLPADAESIWQEGTPGQRLEILRRQRAVDPALARTWAENVWLQEKAEMRGDMVTALSIGLSADDEPFLENALSDRAASVRTIAAGLLAQLPTSALSERQRQRGQDLLRMVDGQIEIHVPEELDRAWQRDGMNDQHPTHISQRSWWMLQLLGQIDPTFWETHLGAPPAELLKRFAINEEWKVQIIEGWTRAALKFHAQDWLVPLWSWWYASYQETIQKHSLLEYDYRAQLFRQMGGPVAEQIMRDAIARNNNSFPEDFSDLLPELPRPWSVEFAQFYLRLVRECCAAEKIQQDGFNPYRDPLLQEIPAQARSLPVACFAEALQPLELPEGTGWQIQHVREQLRSFTEIVHIRQQIYEEIQ
jgi:hypothetical protein